MAKFRMDTTTNRSFAVVMKDTRTLADVSDTLWLYFAVSLSPVLNQKSLVEKILFYITNDLPPCGDSDRVPVSVRILIQYSVRSLPAKFQRRMAWSRS